MLRILSAVGVGFLVLLLATGCGKKWAGKKAPQNATLVVTAEYPGANATETANTVAAPIEQQINGAENLTHLISRCTDDGTYELVLHFRPGTDLEIATVLVQNRVNIALPALPHDARVPGVSVRRTTPGPLMLMQLTGEEHGTLASASRRLREALLRVAGVANVTLSGLSERGLRISLDPDRLTARNLIVSDVVQVLREQNLNVAAAAGAIGQLPQLDIRLSKPMVEPKDLAELVIKNVGEGQVILLRDVAQIEVWTVRDSVARLNGIPGVIVGIYPQAGIDLAELSRNLEEVMKKTQGELPEGLRLQIALDFLASREREYLLLDLHLPEETTPARSRETLLACEKLLREIEGVQDVLMLPSDPLTVTHRTPGKDQPATFLLGLKPKAERDTVAGLVREKLATLREIQPRLRFATSRAGVLQPDGVLHLAICGPELEQVCALAEAFSKQMRQDRKLVDVWVSDLSRPRSQLVLDIDRERCIQMGVPVIEIADTLRTALGMELLTVPQAPERTIQVLLRGGDKLRAPVDLIRQLRIRGAEGRMVPLGTVASVRRVDAPRGMERVDLQSAVTMSANRLSEISFPALQKVFDATRKGLRLSEEYRLKVLPEE